MFQDKILEKYLKPTKYCNFDNPSVKQKIEEIILGVKDDRGKSRRFLEYCKNDIDFFYGNWDEEMLEVLENGRGMCSGKTITVVGMHRCVGIPARPMLAELPAENRFWELVSKWNPRLAPIIAKLPPTRHHVVLEIYLDGKWELHDTTREPPLEAGMKIYGIPTERDLSQVKITEISDYDEWIEQRQTGRKVKEGREEFLKGTNNVLQIIRETGELVLDRESGASELARKAIYTLKNAAEWGELEVISEFTDYLKEVGKKLTETRPNMTPITNLVARALYEIIEKSKEEKELELLKKFAISVADETIKSSAEAVSQAARHANKLIESGDRIVTCSSSSTLNKLFEYVKGEKKEIEVLVAESKFGNKKYGEITAEKLKSYGIEAKLIPDPAIRHNLYKSKGKIFVGADSILSDSYLVNGWPTYWLALAAKDSNLPFYVVCETTKFNPKLRSKEIELEEGFDLIPQELITGIVTERGLVKPLEVNEYMKKMEKYVKILEI
ncbi:MAG: transglutaminase domain-containing protein [Candidatus Aenigmarchaeota archaeon]|nr:transglutaminase domain-containing protein [Candidatus Aenigmarchaeota archaeon]